MELISRQKVMNASLDYATKILNEGAEGCCTDISKILGKAYHLQKQNLQS